MEERLIEEVKALKNRIPHPTYKTLLGQIRTGDLHGAEVGITRLKIRLARKEAAHAHRDR